MIDVAKAAKIAAAELQPRRIMTITEFLLARIAEDQHRAEVEAILRDGDPYYDDGELNSFDRRFDPARVLAECAAKRAIVKWVNDWPLRPAPPSSVDGVLEALAAVYAEHEDYREEWGL
ncbi:DUF6221 family protein [Sinomonas sp. JGH33]|uniref:DUF6221 family protein n=1 Tax=Sinomonas terricola TaxID=3110330 RepID=A0ABU5T179_9MICC|nr:DUF6221 family protein [Sinomonas sp. JGH33]MEA5453282.1 DUF6221 family protein [Sinomonas sp. JGH33]